VREVTLAPAAARQLAEPIGGGLESYYWTFGQYDGTATDSQPPASTFGPTGR